MSLFSISILGITIAPTWYGLMYALGFIFCYIFLQKIGKFSRETLDSLLIYVFFGVVLGGRIGYVLLYNLPYYLSHPIEIFAVWHGGMSFHGGFLGVLIAIWIFTKRKHIPFFRITDILAVAIPVALGLGRIGNWINQELPGFSPYSGPFPIIIDGVSHFPNPLLEMLLEGVVLFIVGVFFLKKGYQKTPGLLSAIFLIGYSTARLTAEMFRLPDVQIGYLVGTSWLTLGMVYTIPIFIAGLFLLFRALKSKISTK